MATPPVESKDLPTAEPILQHKAPPPNAIWGTNRYAGNRTWAACLFGSLIAGPFGCCVFLCPLDERDAYLVDKYIYDASGRIIGCKGEISFSATQLPPAAEAMYERRADSNQSAGSAVV